MTTVILLTFIGLHGMALLAIRNDGKDLWE